MRTGGQISAGVLMAANRFVFIVGFERCMTTMLAAHLVENGYSGLLVPGTKEPGIFAGYPALARSVVERRMAAAAPRLFLDASVSYAANAAALGGIAEFCPQAKIIVCLRNPFQRTLSAFRYYKALHALPIADTVETLRRGTLADGTALPPALLEVELPDTSWVKMLWLKYFEAFRTLPTWRTSGRLGAAFRQQGDQPLPYLLAPAGGRYLFTAMVAAIEGIDVATPQGSERLQQLDREIEHFAATSLPQFILEELRHQRRHGDFPGLSLLRSSFYSYGLETVLKLFPPSQVLVATMDRLPDMPTTDARLRRFLDIDDLPPARFDFQRINDTARYANIPDVKSIAAARTVLEGPLRDDTQRVHELLERTPGVDLSLFVGEPLPA